MFFFKKKIIKNKLTIYIFLVKVIKIFIPEIVLKKKGKSYVYYSFKKIKFLKKKT